jgi:hypothetical protein
MKERRMKKQEEEKRKIEHCATEKRIVLTFWVTGGFCESRICFWGMLLVLECSLKEI